MSQSAIWWLFYLAQSHLLRSSTPAKLHLRYPALNGCSFDSPRRQAVMSAATEAQKRKTVQDAIDRVLFKVPPPLRRHRQRPHARVSSSPLHALALQINELEAILGEFDGNNELLHTKL